MSIVSSHMNNMSSSNLLHPLVHNDSTLKRKRYLEDLEPLDETNKRARTAPPSPPLASVFTRRSLSPTPPSSFNDSAPLKPLPSLSLPTESQQSSSSSAPSSSTSKPTVLVTPQTSPLALADAGLKSKLPKQSALLPAVMGNEFKYLKQNKRYGGISNHSLDYPDTCINDDDWRLNLELWIEKNFPEKFSNLKTLLRSDKPGLDLLNNAILLTELKEQLDRENRHKKPKFTSKISKKMVSNKKVSQSSYGRRFYSDHSDDETSSTPYHHHVINNSNGYTHSSPIALPSQLNTKVNFPYESNYTYTSAEHTPTSPTAPAMQVQPPQPTQRISLPPISAAVKPLNQYQDNHQSQIRYNKFQTQSSPTLPTHQHLHQQPNQHQHQHHPQSHHNYQAARDVVIETNNFIHTQNHKGPNHTYTIHHHNQHKRKCISCGSDQSPCWRPSWSTSAGQLCNSCGLRYKKTGARCMNSSCGRIPAKGEWTAMKSRGKVEIQGGDGSSHLGYKCLHCSSEVEVKERPSK